MCEKQLAFVANSAITMPASREGWEGHEGGENSAQQPSLPAAAADAAAAAAAEATTTSNHIHVHVPAISIAAALQHCTRAGQPLLTLGTMASAHASKMLLVLPLCALFTSCGAAWGKAVCSQAAYWSR